MNKYVAGAIRGTIGLGYLALGASLFVVWKVAKAIDRVAAKRHDPCRYCKMPTIDGKCIRPFYGCFCCFDPDLAKRSEGV